MIRSGRERLSPLAIANTAPDLPPEPGVHATFARDHEHKRLGTVSLLAGIDLLTGQVNVLVKDRHRSRKFIEFLRLLDAAYPRTAINLIPDNAFRAHLQGDQSLGRRSACRGGFEFTVTPKHGSRLSGRLFQACTLRPAPHPRCIQTRTQGSHHGCHG
jgi:hypothetical protein